MTETRGTRKRQEEVIACLIGGMSFRLTAQTLGIGTATVERIAAENRDTIRVARAEQTRRVAEELRDRALYAARRLEEMLDSDNDTVALGAIRTALGEAARWCDAVIVEDRLAAIEARLGLRRVV